MITKKRIRQSIKELPESFTIDELIEQLIFIEIVEEGIQQAEQGKVVSNEDMKKLIEEWSE